ncbi:MAG: carbon-nitrogen hydrolase family protein [Xanthomonadales bacterium]|nr:carbon-nitrogen hydrolase family protein [Xanthomonadales bacterium]
MSRIRVALAQLAPVLMDREATLAKVHSAMREAAGQGAQLVAFGEALVPGYPFWSERTDGARFNSSVQKAMHALYQQQAIDVAGGQLAATCALARELGLAVYLGCMERATDRSHHSLYASLVYIDAQGEIGSVHRKLQPTYDERLNWAPGDGHGLRVHDLAGFRVGGLNCWENWMPLPRAALYGQGENLHVAVWPGSVRNTADITRYLALEGRSYVLSVSAVMRQQWLPDELPLTAAMKAEQEDWLCDGGSCIAAPDGSWLLEPQQGCEGVFVADLDLNRVYEERQNFDPAGHYSRPDVTRLVVNRERQSTVRFSDTDPTD